MNRISQAARCCNGTALLWCRLLAVVCPLGWAVTAGAQKAPDYWPLEVGNRWVYRHTQRDYRTQTHPEGELLLDETSSLEVVSRLRLQQNDYFELSNGQLIRKGPDGSILELKAETERMIFDLGHRDDPAYRIFIPSGAFPFIGGDGYGGTFPYRSDMTKGWSVSVQAGTFSCVYFADGDPLSGQHQIALAADVGPALILFGHDVQENADRYELIAYRINGRTYPTLSGSSSWAQVKRKGSYRNTEMCRERD